MINKFMPCSQQTLFGDVPIQQPSSIAPESSRSSEIFELPHYQISKKSLLNPQSLKKTIVLAKINNSNELQLQDDALQLIYSYSKYELIFCGIYGGKRSGKSSLLDRISKIDKHQERGFKLTAKYEPIKCLRMSKQPIDAGENKKIFYIDFAKGFESSVLSEEQQKLLDLLIIISNSLIVIANKVTSLQEITKHMSVSALRMNMKEKQCTYWPQNLYIVSLDRSLGRDSSILQTYFRRTSLVLWLNNQSKPLIDLRQDIYITDNNKSYRGINLNANIICKLMMKLQQFQNKYKKGEGSINMINIFEDIVSNLAEESYQYHAQLYDATLQQYFDEERPYSMDYLIQAFQHSKELTLDSFQNFSLSKEKQEEYENLLLSYIDQRERLIIEVNKKKSQFMLKTDLQSMSVVNKKSIINDGVSNILENLRKKHQKYEAAGIQSTSHLLLDIVHKIEKGERKAKNRQEMIIIDQTKDLIVDIQNKKHQLLNIQQGKSILRAGQRQRQFELKKNNQRQRQLTSTKSRLQKQIQISKKNNVTILMSKKMLEEKTDKMLELIRQLEERERQNQKAKRAIQAEYDFDPNIQKLKRQLERRERQMQGDFQKLQSVMTNPFERQTQSKLSKFFTDNENKQNKKGYSIQIGLG